MQKALVQYEGQQNPPALLNCSRTLRIAIGEDDGMSGLFLMESISNLGDKIVLLLPQ